MIGDCYSGYAGITLRSDARIIRAACNAHARRKIFEARESYPLLSSQFLAAYQELYDIEELGKFLTVEERRELRGREARAVWDRMRELFETAAARGVLPKDRFGEALGYLGKQWDALQVYLGDGRVPIDNTQAEQLMKRFGDRAEELAVPWERGGGRTDGGPVDGGVECRAERPGRVGVREGRAGPASGTAVAPVDLSTRTDLPSGTCSISLSRAERTMRRCVNGARR
jgi:hypothetical protein